MPTFGITIRYTGEGAEYLLGLDNYLLLELQTNLKF